MIIIMEETMQRMAETSTEYEMNGNGFHSPHAGKQRLLPFHQSKMNSGCMSELVVVWLE